MMTLQNYNHWVQGGGTITSGYRNADGEYDLYICGLGSGQDMRIDTSTIIDNPGREVGQTIIPAGKVNVIKTGSGIVSLSRANRAETYSGKTMVLEGKLQIGEAVRSTEFYVAANAQLDFSSKNYKGDMDFDDFDVTATSLSGYGTVEIGNANNKITLTLNNVVNDGSQFARINAYGKELNLNNSELHAEYVDNNSAITLANSTLVADTLNGSATSKVTITGNSSFNVENIAGTVTLEIPANETQTINTVISGSGELVKAGAGTLELTANNTYSGNTQINGGVLDLTEGKLYSGAYTVADVFVNDGGTLKVNHFGYAADGRGSLGGLTYSSNGSTNVHLNGGTIQITESFGEAINRKIELQTNGGTIDLAEGVELTLSNNIHGSGALTKAGAGTLELTYTNEYTGGTTISQGVLTLEESGTLGTGAVAIAQDAVLNLNHDGAARFDNSVSGSGKIYKNGNGLLKIYNPTENNFVADSFVVNAGELDFKGYFKGALEIGDGAVFSPGNSIGTLTIDGTEVDPQMDAFSLDSGSTLLMEVGYDENNVWTSDKLVVNGPVSIDPESTIIITLLEGTALPSGEFTIDLISGTGAADAYDDFLSVVSVAPYFKDYQIELNGNTIQLTASIDFNAVPEPSTWALLALGVVVLFLRKRNK